MSKTAVTRSCLRRNLVFAVPIEISIDHEHHLLFCSLSGFSSREQLQEFFQEVLRLRKECGLCHILVDANRSKESLGLVELYELGLALADEAFRGLRVAVFSSIPQPGLEFTRTVAGAKPGAKMRTFRDEQAARQWLTTYTIPVSRAPEPQTNK